MTKRDSAEIVNHFARLFDSRGGEAYLGEAVSIAEHMLQAAAEASAAGGAEPLVAAALLHDIAYLTSKRVPDDNLYRHHAAIGAKYLSKYFSEDVCRPVSLHVAAKRYLCAVEPGYFDRLSPASLRTLNLQGGAMSPDEADKFATEDPAAVSLRRWDEAGKTHGLTVPDFKHYRSLLESLATC